MHRSLAGVIIGLAVSASAAALAAAPIDDARGMLAAKKYGQVDSALAGDLAGKSPSPDALRLSLDAAEASGHVVTAEMRVTALLKLTGEKDLPLLLHGARLADLNGDVHIALLRYLGYARAATAADAASDEAFTYILRHELYPQELKKYVGLFGADARSWTLGFSQLNRLLDVPDADRSLDLAGFLIQSFPQPENVLAVQSTIRNAAEGFVFGKDPKDRYLKPLLVIARKEPQNWSMVGALFQQSHPAMSEEARVRFVLDLMALTKIPLDAGILNQFGPDIRALKTDDARAAAAKEYLSHEATYQGSRDGDVSFAYFRQIGESPQAFAIKDKALVTSESMVQRFETLASKLALPQRLGEVQQASQWVSVNYLGADPKARGPFLQKHLAIINRDQVGDLQSIVNGDWNALIAQFAQGRNFQEVLDLRWQQVRFVQSAKDKAGLLALTRDYITSDPGRFVPAQVAEHFIASDLLNEPEKLSLLKEMIDKGGYSPPMHDLLAAMSQDAAHWAKNPQFLQLKADLEKKPAGSDALMRTAVALATISVNQQTPDSAVNEAARTMLAAHPGRIPAGDEDVHDVTDALLQHIVSMQANHVASNGPAILAMADMWLPRVPSGGSNWRTMIARVRERGGAEALLKFIPIYAKLARADQTRNDPAVWQQFISVAYPGAQAASPFTDYYELLTADQALGWLFGQREVWTARRQFIVDEMGKAVSVPGAKLIDPGLIAQLIANFPGWGQAPDFKVPPVLTKALWDGYLTQATKTGIWDPDIEANVYGIYTRGGKEREADAAAQLAIWSELIKKRSIEQQATAYSDLMRWASIPVEPVSAPPMPGFRHYIVFKVMKPLFEQVAPRKRDEVFVAATTAPEIWGAANAPAPPDPKTDTHVDVKTYPQKLANWQAEHDEAVSFAQTLANLLVDGARTDMPPSYAYNLSDLLVRDALVKNDLPLLNRQLAVHAGFIAGEANPEAYWTQTLVPLLKTLEEKKDNEPAYAFLNSLQRKGKFPDAVAKAIMLAKGRAATQIADMIPVNADDPSYALYIAAHALTLGDEQQAWELTAPKLKLLVQLWPAMDPAYVAWSVEQLRKQKMLKEGLDFAFNILLHENDLDPEIAARVLLAKGDSYRDMENFQAARIEYEGLKNNNRYNKTDTGSKAVYRLVDLAIVTKDYNTAESLLERLVDSDSVQKQADAYYLYAKMAYQKSEFKESRDYLRKVKERVLNHVEAALLEGELNLVLPGGLQNTEVAIGDPRLATVVIPGRQLTLTLQDPNLSIARGGAAIPVVVTAAKSGDVEHVKLLPSSSNKNLFTARIATALGKAQLDNLTLELRGDDVVSYTIEPGFQKANDLHYAAKQLDVRYDARLVASSGEILTEEEEEKRELERQLQMRQAGTSRRFDLARDGRTIRPGSKIFVQVTDFCEDLTDEADKVKVDLKTGLGDVLQGVELTETGLHTGIFRGAVPSGLPLPRATASDPETSHSIAGIISANPIDVWTSLPDGRKGKWVEVDTMGSKDVGSLTADIPHLDQITDISVLGMLADDFEVLATSPEQAQAARGGLVLDYAPDQHGERVDEIHRYLKLATASTTPQESPAFDRDATPMKGREGWCTSRVKGVFYLTQNRVLEVKWLSPPPPQDWLRRHLLIDAQEVLDGHNSTTINHSGRVELTKGPHTYELLVRDNFGQSKVAVGYKNDAGAYEPIPADWFSITSHPELSDHLKPKGKITRQGDRLTLTLDHPRRLRKLRVQFNDYLGNAVSVKSIAINDGAGKAIVPVSKDFSGPAASVLPISPGDTVSVSYDDRRRLREETKVITSTLNSSYYNGRIILAEETITGVGDQRRTEYLDAKRVRRGDQLSVLVTDYDDDTTEERDTVPVTVTTSSGEKLVLHALETWTNGVEQQNNHAGEFIAVLKIGDTTAKDTIKVLPGDKLTISYLDKENTDPGIPIERVYTVNEAGAGIPDVMVYRTRVNIVPDESAEARARVKRIVGRDVKGAFLGKQQVIARHPEYTADNAAATRPANGDVVAAVNAPLLFEVNYPEHVLNAGSVLEVTAVADSELKAAVAQKRQPRLLKVPAYVMGIERLAQIKGYPIRLESGFNRDEHAMLRDGIFAGVIRLQIGSPDDPVDDMVVNGEREFSRDNPGPMSEQAFWYKVPTLIVAGSDTVHLRIRNDSGSTSETTVRLLSDGRLELLDNTYTLEEDALHLGEKFHIKLTDPDHDISDARDTVKVRARSATGSDITITLNETLPHSGVFTGTLEPQFVGEKANSAAGTTSPTTNSATRPTPQADSVRDTGHAFYVNFGDAVTFDYVDDLSLQSSSPVLVSKAGRILFGADGQVAVFTKKFKDPEIAVKTRFLMAESLFEMAKEHRKLSQNEQAEEEISRGKRVLEEAIRDYPNTSFAAQGDYLLANLAQELGKYQEAVGRYSNVISTFPDSEYASQSQYKKALCFEKLQNFDQACEEYVKLTYIYPDSTLVADATVHLGNYYYKKQSYKIAGKIFHNFQQKNPSHRLAAEALFLAAQCNYKLADYPESIRLFQKVVDDYTDEKTVRPEAMYWLADSDVKANENVKAYQTFKKVTWDYPDSEWAKRARGRLTEDAFSHMQDEQ